MPVASISRRRKRAQNEWNVLSQTSLAASPIMRSTRSRISVAALLVNVMARMLYGATPCARRFAMRQVRTFVLPEPAPAMMSSGPSVCATAFFCAGFKPLKISKISSNLFLSPYHRIVVLSYCRIDSKAFPPMQLQLRRGEGSVLFKHYALCKVPGP